VLFLLINHIVLHTDDLHSLQVI